MKGIIAVPTSSHFYLIKKFTLDLIELRLVFDKLFPDNSFIYSESAWIENARNIIWQRAKKAQPDWVLMIDSDMTFTPRDALTLVKHIKNGYDFVSGMYYAGAQPHMPLVYKETDREYERETVKSVTYYNDYPKLGKDFFEIAGCGLGFAIVSGRLLQTMPDLPFKRLPSWFGKEIKGEESLEEDLSFCKRVKDAGFKIYCDATVQLGHLRIVEVNKEYLDNLNF